MEPPTSIPATSTCTSSDSGSSTAATPAAKISAAASNGVAILSRVGEIHDAFQTAIKEFEYAGRYCCVYPIKVNQQRHVVEEILDFGKPFNFGLEAGSKPELLAVLAVTNGHPTPIICNGFKDDEFIKMVVLARKIGKESGAGETVYG